MVVVRYGYCRRTYVLAVIIVGLWAALAAAQGPFVAPSGLSPASSMPSLTGNSLLPGPSGSLGGAPGSDTVSICSGMFPSFLPPILNLEVGYTYGFGPYVRQGRVWGDFVFPVSLSGSSVIFGEAHGELENFGKRPSVTVAALPGVTTDLSMSKDRVDLSLGGGYRTILNGNTLVGANAFFDT